MKAANMNIFDRLQCIFKRSENRKEIYQIEISILPMAELIKDIHISSLHEKQFLNQTILQVLKS
jgi:hypothetical protein